MQPVESGGPAAPSYLKCHPVGHWQRAGDFRAPELGGGLEQAEQSLVKLRTDDLVWRQVGDEVMVLDLATSQYLSVNPTGSVLWPLLVEGSQRGDLVRELVEHFEVDEATAAADTETFLSSLSNFLLTGLAGTEPGR